MYWDEKVNNNIEENTRWNTDIYNVKVKTLYYIYV